MKRHCSQLSIRRFRYLAAIILALLCGRPAAILAQTGSASVSAARRVVVATKEAPPFAMKDADGNWTGISIELWSHIAEALHWQTTFQEYATVPEMLKATAEHKVDAAVAAITVTGERERMVDFTQPFFSTGLGIAVPQRRELEWMPIVRNIVSWRFAETVAILVGLALAVGILIW